jgi:hypothetical protein
MTDYENWNLRFSGAGVLLSTLISCIALWSNVVRDFFSRPILLLKLHSETGDLLYGDPYKPRYYHLVVTNGRRRTSAKNAEVRLTGIERPCSSGGWKWTFKTNFIPLHWQNAVHYQHPPDIGPDRYCDLGFLQKSEPFVLSTAFPLGNMNFKLERDQQMRVHLQAVADNAESNPLVLELAWDGDWHEGDAEMAKHFVVKVVKKKG